MEEEVRRHPSHCGSGRTLPHREENVFPLDADIISSFSRPELESLPSYVTGNADKKKKTCELVLVFSHHNWTLRQDIAITI